MGMHQKLSVAQHEHKMDHTAPEKSLQSRYKPQGI